MIFLVNIDEETAKSLCVYIRVSHRRSDGLQRYEDERSGGFHIWFGRLFCSKVPGPTLAKSPASLKYEEIIRLQSLNCYNLPLPVLQRPDRFFFTFVKMSSSTYFLTQTFKYITLRIQLCNA